jgi:hypothetical protein
MSDFVDIKGMSGRAYRFMRLKEGRPLSPMGGNFLYARRTGDRLEVLYAGEVQNLLKDARERWSEATERFQVTELYTRLNISEGTRRLEHADIIEGVHPPMNPSSELKAS